MDIHSPGGHLLMNNTKSSHPFSIGTRLTSEREDPTWNGFGERIIPLCSSDSRKLLNYRSSASSTGIASVHALGSSLRPNRLRSNGLLCNAILSFEPDPNESSSNATLSNGSLSSGFSTSMVSKEPLPSGSSSNAKFPNRPFSAPAPPYGTNSGDSLPIKPHSNGSAGSDGP